MVGDKIKLSRLKLTLLTILLLTIHSITGCKPDEEDLPDTFTGAKVLIANQGNFGWGEGTLSVYYEGSETIDNEVYKRVNGESVGNVFQSIAKVEDKFYFVINNSGRLVVADTGFKKIDIVDDFISPRYFYQTDKYTGYMTDLYANKIYLMDLASNSSTAVLLTSHWAEKGVIAGDLFWYTAPATNKIFSLDIASDQFKDSIVVGEKPESIIRDKNGVIWVLCKGDESKNESAKLTSVRIEGGDITAISFDIKGVPTSLAYDKESHSIYFLSDRIWRFKPDEDNAPQSWVQVPDAEFYTVAVNPASGDVYVSDVKDFVSKSTIYRYSREGALLDEFSAGIIAGDFFFP